MKALRFLTCGNVDDGKSTLIGRLLYDTKAICVDTLEKLEKISKKSGKDEIDLALLTDGLKSEREQGITIDVAYRYFHTLKRSFIIADCPGHEQYTRNMVTGASNCDVGVILVDASKGLQTQSKRHTVITSILGIKKVIIAINKMDLIEWSKRKYNAIIKEFKPFLDKLDFEEIVFVPISALKGDNIAKRSKNMDWYNGEIVLEILETIDVDEIKNPFRFPIQNVLRADKRYLAGRILSGSIKTKEDVVIFPGGFESKIKTINFAKEDLKEAKAGQSITITLEDEIDVDRGAMIVEKGKMPSIIKSAEPLLCWLGNEPLNLKKKYIIKNTTNETIAIFKEIKHKINVNSLEKEIVQELKKNEVGVVNFKLSKSLIVDSYALNRLTGCFIVIDYQTNNTVAAGIFL